LDLKSRALNSGELFVAFPSCAANGSERKIAVLLVAFFIQPDVHTQMSRYIYVSSNGCVEKAQMASHADKSGNFIASSATDAPLICS